MSLCSPNCVNGLLPSAAFRRPDHRVKLRWDLAEHAHDLGTPEGRVFCGLNALGALRKSNPAFGTCADLWTLDTGDNGLLASMLAKKSGNAIGEGDLDAQSGKSLPGLLPAIAGPVVVIILLALRPIASISIDPLIALPVGGMVSILVTGNAKSTVPFKEFGLSKVVGVSVLLVGTGAIAGIIKASVLQYIEKCSGNWLF